MRVGGKGERLQQLLPKGELLGPVANKGQGEGAGLRDSKRWGRHSLACMYAWGGESKRVQVCETERAGMSSPRQNGREDGKGWVN